MGIFEKQVRKALWINPVLMGLLIAGCAGLEPYEPRNDREEGPEKGLFTGSEGEFVILKKSKEPASAGEASE